MTTFKTEMILAMMITFLVKIASLRSQWPGRYARNDRDATLAM